jgi:hypothetical protein
MSSEARATEQLTGGAAVALVDRHDSDPVEHPMQCRVSRAAAKQFRQRGGCRDHFASAFLGGFEPLPRPEIAASELDDAVSVED